MEPESLIDVINVAALMTAALMIAVAFLPDGQGSVGEKRNGQLLILLCVTLAVRVVLQSAEPVWVQEVRSLLGISAGILLPWIVWRLCRDIRPKTESEKTG